MADEVEKSPPRRKPEVVARDDELSDRVSIRKALLDVFRDVDKGFIDSRDRSDDTMDFWDLYNSKLGDRQFYNGNAKVFVPITRNAVRARKTRFVNQIFPQTGRYVAVTTADGDIPYGEMALLEHYIDAAKLRTEIMPALIVSGDVEGQYSLYVDWTERKRHTARKVKTPVRVEMTPGEEVDVPEAGEEVDIEEEVVTDAGPDVEVIADSDLLILPATANSIEDALESGGSVTVQRRWTKAKIKAMIKRGNFTKSAGENLIATMRRSEQPTQRRDAAKDQVKAIGIKGAGKYVLGYETWTRLKVGGETRLCRAYYAGEDTILGCKLCPYWCDRVPVITCAVEKAPGSIKGRPLLADVIDMQVLANDSVNQGADTASFSAMPIIMTDPEKNPKTGSMILGLAAVWEVDPNSTQFAKFPEMWKDSFELVASCKNEIFQTLGVNPSMVPQSTGGKSKRNQAELATEQQVDVLTTADSVTVVEQGILTPLLERFAEYDAQFRDEDLSVRVWGRLGQRANMEMISPIQQGKRHVYRWLGVEAARNAAAVQQKVSFLNVLTKIPPTAYPGKKLDVAPVLDEAVATIFGPSLAPLVFIDLKEQMSMDPNTENEMLAEGFDVHISPMDDDQKHIRVHLSLLQSEGDPAHVIRYHIQQHQAALQAKAQQAMQAQQGGPPQGAPGGPQAGAQVGPAGGGKGPPGQIPPDQMPAAGGAVMPRKT